MKKLNVRLLDRALLRNGWETECSDEMTARIYKLMPTREFICIETSWDKLYRKAARLLTDYRYKPGEDYREGVYDMADEWVETHWTEPDMDYLASLLEAEISELKHLVHILLYPETA
jgi:hypothetical protein